MPPSPLASAVAVGPFVVGGVFVLVAVGIVVYALRERRWLRELAGRGIVTDARIERVKATTSATSQRPGPVRLRYRAVVSFRTEDGREWTATTRWPTYVRPQVGVVAPVRYDPERPKRVIAAEGPGSVPPSLAGYLVIAGFSFVIGWVAITVGRTFG